MPPTDTMQKKNAWSYSRLTAYETCPHRYNLTTVTKKVVEPQTEALRWGNQVHTALEQFASKGKPLTGDLKRAEAYVNMLFKRKGKRIVENKLTLNDKFRPTKWMARDAWVRGIVDIGVIGSKKAWLLDWKTGKRRVDSKQMELMAALTFAHFPWIDKVTTGFVWLKSTEFDSETFSKSDVPAIWEGFLARVSRYDRAYAEGKWPAKPSGLCKNWCPVGPSNCEFCGS